MMNIDNLSFLHSWIFLLILAPSNHDTMLSDYDRKIIFLNVFREIFLDRGFQPQPV